MNLETAIATEIHGAPIGRSSIEVYCDQYHDPPKPVDFERRIQYECIRFGDSLPVPDEVGSLWTWAPDLLRCADCEINSLGEPTAGYGEALVEIDVGWSHQQRVIDARDITVLDHSPVDEGADPPSVPKAILKTMAERPDWGFLRRSRLAHEIEICRKKGNEDIADAIGMEP